MVCAPDSPSAVKPVPLAVPEEHFFFLARERQFIIWFDFGLLVKLTNILIKLFNIGSCIKYVYITKKQYNQTTWSRNSSL